MVSALILLSQFKHDMLLMTLNFVDVMIVDADTSPSCSRFSRTLRGS